MRLVFVIPYFYPAWQYGGQPRSCYELARVLVRRGHSVKVLTTDSAGNARLPSVRNGSQGPEQVDGIEVFYYRNFSNYLAFRHRFFWPSGFFRNLDEQLSDCDALHIHELRSTLTPAAYHAAQRRKVPYVLSTHGGLTHLGKRPAKQLFDRLYGRTILRDASVLAVVSPQEEKEALAFNVEAARTRLLPNTVFPEDYATLPPRGGFRAQWSIKPDSRLVLFLGRLHWIKGADLLIQAFTNSLERHPDTTLVLAGPDDGQEGELRRLVADSNLQHRVRFTGYLDHQAKLKALVDTDVLVIPSRKEIFAIVALEALLCGTPVLLSSACGLFPMPSQDCGVRQFQTENQDDLARQLLQMVSGKEPKADVETMKNFVCREFSPAAVAERAESLYGEAISNRKPN